MRSFIALSVAIVAVACGGPNAAPAPEVASMPVVRESSSIPSDELASFSTPRQLCAALEAHGLPTRSWKSDGIDWSCSSDYRSVGPSAATIPTNISFYVIGDSPTTAHTAKLVLNVNNPVTRDEGLRQLDELATALMQATVFEAPPTLAEFISNGEPVEIDSDDERYAVEWERTKIDTYRLIVSDLAALEDRAASKAVSVQNAAGLFESCKDAIARDLGNYSRSALQGDGEPIQEPGYQSFMLEGRDGDLFFCEVYPDGTYKIKAAFARQFPFKYVASGKL